MRKFLSFLLTVLFIFQLFWTVFAYLPTNWLVGEIKFDQNNIYATWGSISSGGFTKYPKDTNSPWWYWYANGNQQYFFYNSVQNITFWFKHNSNFWEIFNSQGLVIKTISNSSLEIRYNWDFVWTLNYLSNQWNFLSISFDWTLKKMNINLNWVETDYPTNITVFSSSVYIKDTYVSLIRGYWRLLSVDEKKYLYEEPKNILPIISQSGNVLNFNEKSENLNLNLWTLTDSNTWVINLEYSLNGQQYSKFSTSSVISPVNQYPLSMSLPAKDFFYWQNTFSLRAFDGYGYSNTWTYTVNKNFFNEFNVSTWTLVSNFHFKSNLSSEQSNSSFSFNGTNLLYLNQFTFPEKSISLSNYSDVITLYYPYSNLETISFWHKWSGEFFTNWSLVLSYDNTNGYRINNTWNIWPKNDSWNWHMVTLRLDKVQNLLFVDIDWGKYTDYIAYFKDNLHDNNLDSNKIKLKQWSFAFIKIWSSQVTSGDIAILYRSLKNTPPVLSSSGSISFYSTDSEVNIPLVVNDQDSEQSITYYYSFSWTSFSQLWYIWSTPTGTGWQNLTFSWELFPIWNSKIFLKVSDWKEYSNVIEYNINKIQNNINLMIDESWINDYWVKKIRATTNLWNLFYAITQENICDDSLEFLPYQDLNFSDVGDNWKRVCFKVAYNEEFMYKISSPIQNIWDKTTNIKNSDVYDNHLLWKKSKGLKDFDPLYILITSQISKSIQWTSWWTTTKNYQNILTDVNGDWLPDLILINHFDIQFSIRYPWETTTGNFYERQSYYALLLNKWNMDFDVKYRCVVYQGLPDWYSQQRNWYYWDCAQ